jgi:hypothetical protein
MTNKEPIKNPFRIIWISKNKLLSPAIWVIWWIIILGLIFGKLFLPQITNYNNLDLIAQIATESIAIVLGILTVGAYKSDDIIKLYKNSKEHKLYYNFIADYLLTALLWFLCCMGLVFKTIIIFECGIITDIANIVYLSIVSLALLSLVDLFIKSINRISNKVYIGSLDKK